MKFIRSLILGLLASAGSSLLVVGAMLAAVSEGLLLQIMPELPIETLPVVEETYEPGVPTATRLPTRTAVPGIRFTIIPSICARPPGWIPYTVQGGDTAASLAAERGITTAELVKANCLPSATLIPNTIIFLPVLPTPTKAVEPTATLTPSRTPLRCGPPVGWVQYRIRPGDTLMKIGNAYGVSVDELKFANCLTSSFIRSGDYLYVPNVTPRFPTSTRTPLPTFTSQPPPTRTFTGTAIASRTFTFTPQTPTATRPTATSTPQTGTPTPVATSTNTGTPPSATPTPTVPSPTPTFTPTR